MTRLFLFILLLLGSAPAYAEWMAVVDNDVYTRYVDLDTIRRKGNLVRMWVLDNYKKAKDEQSDLGSSKTQIEYNCAEERARRLEWVTFSGTMGRGKEGYLDIEVTPWHPMSTKVGADLVMWEFACGKK